MSLRPESAIAIMFCSTVFAPIAVILRFWFRLGPKSPQHFWTTCSRIHEAFFIIITAVGIGVANIEVWIYMQQIKQRTLPEDEYIHARNALWQMAFKMGYIELLLWTLIMWSVKAAFMCLYIDMAKYLPSHIRYIIHCTCCILAVTFVATAVTFALACRPVWTNWSLTADLCTPQTVPSTVHIPSVLHLITDAMVLCIPVLIFRIVPIHRRERLAVKFIICLGGATVSVGILCYALRIQGLVEITRVKNFGDVATYIQEVRKRTESVRLASGAEAACGMFVLCLPSFRVLLRKNSGNGQSLNSGPRQPNVDALGSYHSDAVQSLHMLDVESDQDFGHELGSRSEDGLDVRSEREDLGARTMYMDDTPTPRASRYLETPRTSILIRELPSLPSTPGTPVAI
ncbi:hypothetical protein K440DRAFT_116375 [Wilcoxina mikolae CBS 423.85]|nr:hypothetical protein K440DRAFT_116375 [Wilcoxina mikolae CBS 423.85]